MEFRMLVGIAVSCFATLSLAETHKRAVVFDIDGTLTPHVYALSFARDDAAAAVQVYADAGVRIVYLTARVPLFQSGVSAWLDENGFPSGTLHLTETDADRDDHGAFKTRVLQGYRTDGWSFVAAFGDSSSDFAAYQAAGVPHERVFALQRVGAWDSKSGVWQGCYQDWVDLGSAIAETLVR